MWAPRRSEDCSSNESDNYNSINPLRVVRTQWRLIYTSSKYKETFDSTCIRSSVLSKFLPRYNLESSCGLLLVTTLEKSGSAFLAKACAAILISGLAPERVCRSLSTCNCSAKERRSASFKLALMRRKAKGDRFAMRVAMSLTPTINDS